MEILKMGEETLREVSSPVSCIDDEIKKLIDEMFITLEKSNGIGLAAPQVDVSLRMTAVLVPDENNAPLFKHILVNPTILSESVRMAALSEGEGCLSVDREVPGYVPRHDRITLRWYDLDGNKHVEKLRDYVAIVCQHEIDHLNGILFYDHINKENPFKTDPSTILIG